MKVTIGTQSQKTKTHRSAGKTPRWEETLRFKVSNEEELKLEVYDEDLITHDLVGETTYFLDEIKAKKKISENVKIAY